MPPVYGYFIDGLSFNTASCWVPIAIGAGRYYTKPYLLCAVF